MTSPFQCSAFWQPDQTNKMAAIIN